MAVVTGYTAARMKQIEDDSVVSGTVDQSTKHLMLATRGGVILDAGLLTGPKGDKGDPGLGNVNTVNSKFGPDIVLLPSDVGAVPTTQFSTEAQRGIVELATTAEAIALTDTDRAITPRTLAAVGAGRWERTGATIAVIGSGFFAGQTALLVLATTPTFPIEVVWTGSRWEPISWKLSGSNSQRTAFEASGVCFEGVEWYSTTDKNSRLWNGSAWVLTLAGIVPVSPTSVSATAGTATIGPTGLITFAGVPGVKINGVFSADYKYYKLLYRITGVSAVANVAMYFRYMAGGVDQSTSYSFTSTGATTAGASKILSGGNLTGGTLGIVSSVYSQSAGDLTIYLPFETVNTTLLGNIQGMDSSQAFGSSLTNIHQQNGSYDGFYFYVLSPGLITGTARFYGYN